MATNVTHSDLGKDSATPARNAPMVGDSSLVAPATERLVSLDVFRGFIMLWLAGGDEVIRSLHAVGKNFVLNVLVYEFNHTPWHGLRFYDCIWPSFMFMVGLSIPFAVAKRAKTQSERQIIWHAVSRATVLFLLGSIRESVFLGHPYLIELSSALQPIAIAYLVAFLLAKKSVRVQAVVASLILVGYALLLAFVPAPGIPAGTYEHNHNLVNYVDVLLLPQHWNVWPYAPEGWGTILSTIPTISTTILGLIIGELLMSLTVQERQGQDHCHGRSCWRGPGMDFKPFYPGGHEDVDDILWGHDGRLGLPDVRLLPVVCRRSRAQEMDPTTGSNWNERRFHLHVYEHYPGGQNRWSLYRSDCGKARFFWGAFFGPRGFPGSMAIALLDVQKENLH